MPPPPDHAPTRESAPCLVARSGPLAGRRIPLERELLLGRDPLAGIEIQDPSVSRRHARVTIADDACFLADLRSRNGTFHNGRRITEPVQLASGDEIRVGSSVFVFHCSEHRRQAAAAPKATVRPDDPAEMSRSVVRPLTELTAGGARQLSEEVALLQRRLAFVLDVSRVLARTPEESRLFPELLERMLAALPNADRALVLARDETTGRFRTLGARTRSGTTMEIRVSQTLLEEVVRRREALVSLDVGADTDLPAAESIRFLGLRSVACVPLLVDDRLVGVLQVDNVRHGRGFSEADLDLLDGLAGPIGLAIEHAELHQQALSRAVLEHDLALARRLQLSFLPGRMPSPPGWRFAAEYTPIGAVGGDLYDCLPLRDGHLAFAIGDVSGKGIAAALLMARLTGALRRAAALTSDPAAVLEALNDEISAEADQGMFATLLFGVLTPDDGRIVLVNAGHPPPLLRRTDGGCHEIELAAGAPLGMRHPLAARPHTLTLSRNELLVMYTDGLSEAANPAGERFEVERIRELVGAGDGDPERTLDCLLKTARSFVSTRGFDDDLTVLCLGRR